MTHIIITNESCLNVPVSQEPHPRRMTLNEVIAKAEKTDHQLSILLSLNELATFCVEVRQFKTFMITLARADNWINIASGEYHFGES